MHDADSPTRTPLAHAVDGSPKCGSCWQLQYNGQPPVYMVAVDNAAMIQLGGPAFAKFAGAAGKAKGGSNESAQALANGDRGGLGAYSPGAFKGPWPVGGTGITQT
ncbi:hypothetical protein V8D89_009843 [Ganoderma adspersum]